jgi:hypothetical protein
LVTSFTATLAGPPPALTGGSGVVGPVDHRHVVPANENFKSYIHVEGESTVPYGITIFAATGGRWNVIELPEGLVDLPLADQMAVLETLMRAYLDEYRGECPFFGRVTGFRLVRREESIRFSPDGKFVEGN